MADLVQTGAEWLESKRKAHRATNVTVWRGGLSFTALATKGFTATNAFNNDDVIVQEKSEDFTIAVADYDFGRGPVEPMKGDTIEDAGVVFEVLPMSAEPEKRYSDNYRLSWRIHTRQIA